MKTLTLSALLCAMMALTRAAAHQDAEDGPWRAKTIVKDTEAGYWDSSGESPRVCPSDWTAFNGRCFLYVHRTMSWAVAERNCMSMGGHLASVHNIQEYHEIQRIIETQNQGETWIGGSDAEEDGYWFWSDGTPFYFTHWCPGEPNNYEGHQKCLQMNHSDQKCWDDRSCDDQLPSVCARNS